MVLPQGPRARLFVRLKDIAPDVVFRFLVVVLVLVVVVVVVVLVLVVAVVVVVIVSVVVGDVVVMVGGY